VIVEHELVPDESNMVSRMADTRSNPHRLEAGGGVDLEEGICEHVARAGGKEHSIR
jgi:hypothetical protein